MKLGISPLTAISPFGINFCYPKYFFPKKVIWLYFKIERLSLIHSISKISSFLPQCLFTYLDKTALCNERGERLRKRYMRKRERTETENGERAIRRGRKISSTPIFETVQKWKKWERYFKPDIFLVLMKNFLLRCNFDFFWHFLILMLDMDKLKILITCL